MGGSDLNASLVVHRTVLTVLEANRLLEVPVPAPRKRREHAGCSSTRSSQGSRTLCRLSGMFRLVSQGVDTLQRFRSEPRDQVPRSG
jgi:hypothetical protein